MRHTVLLSVLLAASSAPALAQETRVVPDYPVFMEMCMESISPDLNKESAVLAAAILCECTHGNLPKDGTMTREEFDVASQSCATEAGRDGEAFARKYLKVLEDRAAQR